MKIFGREPTLWIQAVAAILTFLVTFGWDALTADQAGALVAVLVALAAAVNALLVRQAPPTVWSGFIQAGAALLGAYGLNISQEQVGLLVLAVAAVMTLIVRVQVEPKGSPPQPVPPVDHPI